MRSTLEEFSQEITALEALIESFNPVSSLLAAQSNPVIRNYVNVRRQFDYAAFVVALYASFEKYCEGIVLSLSRLRSQRIEYRKLPKELQARHEQKSFELLHRARYGKGRHKSITPQSVVQNLSQCMANAEVYELNETALVSHDANLRAGELRDLFRVTGFTDIVELARRRDELLTWYAHDKDVDLNSFADEGVPFVTIESVLEDIVERRNQIAHHGGRPDDIIGPEEMRRLVTFIQAMCESIFSILAAAYLSERYIDGKEAVSGNVREGPLKDGHVVIIDNPSANLHVHQSAFAVGGAGRAVWGYIKEIRIDDESVPEVSKDSTTPHLGIELTFKVPRHQRLYILPEPDAALWA